MISTGHCRWLFLILSLTSWINTANTKEMRVVCYYTNWSVYRPGTATFTPQNINPYLCTHLIYAFGGFTKDNTLKPYDKYQDIEKGGYAKFTGLKTYNKNLKTMLAIGGWNEGSTRFSPMVSSSDRRKKLVRNAIKFLRQNRFDGLDLDWEYPSFRDGGKPRDRDNYAQLVQELREEFEKESEKTGRPRLLLTMAVPAGIEYVNKGYDIPKLTKYLDWMNILSYDYHSAYEPAVNHHAPLYPLEEDNEYNYDAELTIDYTIKHYLEMGAEANKLVLGIPTYGRSYTLFNPDAYEIGSPADGPGTMGDATRENGFLSYYEICENIKSNDWEVEQPNPKAMGPYAFKDNQWVGYDDENIARVKAEYVAENGLGGIMFWSIDNDDFRGTCHGKPYPLIEAAKEALLNAYGLTDDNLISPPSKPIKSRTRSRPKPSRKVSIPDDATVTKVEKPTNRRRNNRIKSKTKEEEPEEAPKSARRSHRRKDTKKEEEEEVTYSSLKVITPSYTTPAPPSTPDLDGAFKCEDEGFFPHPKDCKKYFWCLSGAGDSGLVAHQFTCPAGLYFNKAADSCDYSQNVLCNKKLQRATTSTTSTTTEATSAITSTTIQSVRTRPSTLKFLPKTTTEAYEDEEYEYEDDDEEDVKSEEDPRVIKELIDLIKKAGGIEELEKQLKVPKDGSHSSSGDSTTPSSISKALVEKVLSKAARNTLTSRKSLYVPRNSRGPQNEGLRRDAAKINTSSKTERGKLQYTSISRSRPSATPSEDAVEESSPNEEVNDSETTSRKFSKSNQLEYVNIRRPKASTTTEASDTDRNRVLGETSTEEEEMDEDDDNNAKKDSDKLVKNNESPQYVNIIRQKPSTTESSLSTSKYVQLRRGTTSASAAIEDNEETTPKYKTIRRGTTSAPSSEDTSASIKSTRGTTTAATAIDTLETTSERSHTFGVASKTDEITAVSLKPDEKTGSSPLASTTPYISTENDTLTNTISAQNHLSSKDEINDTTTEAYSDVENNSVTDAKTTYSTESTSSSESTSERIVLKKRPQLFDPRPFSTRSTTSKPITESTIKTRTTFRHFRVGVRRKPSTASPSSPTTTPSPATTSREPFPRPTKTKPRRKYSTTTQQSSNRILESQETTPKSILENRFRFVSRKPFFRQSTKAPEAATTENTDQFSESSNQQSLEENFEGGKTTELVDIAEALRNIQKAPFPSKNYNRSQTKIIYPKTQQRISNKGQQQLSNNRQGVTSPTSQTVSTRSRFRYSTTPVPPPSTTFKLAAKKTRPPPPQAFEKVSQSSPIVRYQQLPDYDYYDVKPGSLGRITEHSKVLLHSNGVIECLDQGSFPHPVSCKKFISCARMENGHLLGWEYTCPKNLSFDPIGGICNWATELGCSE